MTNAEPITLPAPVIEAIVPTPDKWALEHQAFRRQLPELLHRHPGQYVAVHGGQVDRSGTPLAARAAADGQDPGSPDTEAATGHPGHGAVEDVDREPAGLLDMRGHDDPYRMGERRSLL